MAELSPCDAACLLAVCVPDTCGRASHELRSPTPRVDSRAGQFPTLDYDDAKRNVVVYQ